MRHQTPGPACFVQTHVLENTSFQRPEWQGSLPAQDRSRLWLLSQLCVAFVSYTQLPPRGPQCITHVIIIVWKLADLFRNRFTLRPNSYTAQLDSCINRPLEADDQLRPKSSGD